MTLVPLRSVNYAFKIKRLPKINGVLTWYFNKSKGTRKTQVNQEQKIQNVHGTPQEFIK